MGYLTSCTNQGRVESVEVLNWAYVCGPLERKHPSKHWLGHGCINNVDGDMGNRK